MSLPGETSEYFLRYCARTLENGSASLAAPDAAVNWTHCCASIIAGGYAIVLRKKKVRIADVVNFRFRTRFSVYVSLTLGVGAHPPCDHIFRHIFSRPADQIALSS